MTGTLSAFFTPSVVISTWTGAWSSVPASFGRLSVMWMGSVAGAASASSFPEDVATVPIRVTTPGVVRLSGSVICAPSPFLTSDCWDGSRFTTTSRRFDEASMTGRPGIAPVPFPAVTLPIRSGPGRDTAWPRSSLPVTSAPRSSWSFSSAAAVAQPKWPESGSSLGRSA